MPQNLDICCTTFCAEACLVAVKVTDTENDDGSEQMTDKNLSLKKTKHYLPKEIIGLKMTKLFPGLPHYRTRTYHKMTKLFTHKKSLSSSQALPIQEYNLS